MIPCPPKDEGEDHRDQPSGEALLRVRTSVCVHARASARPLRWPGFLRSVSLRSQLWFARAGVASLRAEAGASGSAAGGRSFAGRGGRGPG